MKRFFLCLALLLVCTVPAFAATTLYSSHYSNATQTNVSAPTGTASTTGVMTGLAGSITPAYTGTIVIVISGAIASGTTGDGAKVQASYGTGGAPSNAATITGTQCGGRPIYTAAAAGSDKVPFSVNCVVTGLTVGTAYWIDATLAAVTGGTASIANVSVSAYEL